MRPVTRGDAPALASTYKEMGKTLFERIGKYCSYCEYAVSHTPHVEHIVPKDKFPGGRDDWENLLVACGYCNSHKSRSFPKPDTIGEYLWPTRDNTARAFRYSSGVPEVNPSLTQALQTKAARTRGLVKLGLPNDERFRKRAEIFNLAQRYRSRLANAPDPNLLREAIVDLAHSTGFFSIWMTVFADDPDMKRRFIAAFPGTCASCFDPNGNPLPRPGGAL